MRRQLGSWTTPDGNSVEAVLVGRGIVRDVVLTWDTFPLSDADQVHYRTVILPEVIARTREYLELAGPALVVTP